MKRSRGTGYTFAIFIGTALLLCALATGFVIRDIQKNSYLERTISLNTVMSKIGEHLNVSFNKEWEQLRALTMRTERLNGDSVDALIAVLNDIYMELGVDFKVVDENGIAYYHDGTHEYWKDHRSVMPEKETFLFSTLQFGVTNEYFMKYIMPLKEPLVIGDVKIIYSVLNEPLSALQRDFDTSSFGDGCLSFVIDKNGAFIYENGSNDRMADSYNLLSYLEKNVEFQYGETFAQFKETLQNGTNDTVLIKYAGTNYFLSFYTLALDNWVAVLLVPEANIQSNNITLTQRLLFDISLVFAAVALVFILGFLHMWRKTVIRQRLAAEAERRSNEAKTNFLSSMSHDIRTPMNAVIGLTEIALRCKEPVPSSVRGNLEKIQLSSNHLLTLINDILDINQIESGQMPINVAEFSIVNTINTLINMVRTQAEKKDINLHVHAHNIYQEYLLGDELRVNQVYINLAINAIKYTPSGGRVEIEFKQEAIEDCPNKLRLICTVKDNGIGMSEDFQKVMYRSFLRGTDTRVNTVVGSGLGLTICHRIVNMMDGTLSCVSALDKGTTFIAALPLEKGKPDAVYKLPKMQVLIVDHDVFSAADLERGFGKLGVAAQIIHDPAELPALLARDTAYQLAFVELGVPRNSGLNAVRQLHGRFGEDFPVILTDIADMAEYSKQIAEAGVALTMSKPYFYRRVYEMMQTALGAKTGSAIAQHEAQESFPSGMHVLVAEDNDLNWEILCELLELSGVTASRAGNGQICVDMLEKSLPGQYSAVLMDVRMPIMDGCEAARCIRKSEQAWMRAIPIIAMTADAFNENIRECLDAGMDAHLSKPIDMKKLLTVLRNIKKDASPSSG